MRSDSMRKVAILAAAAVAGVAALALQYLLRPTPLPASGEYFLTELAQAQIGPISVLIALVTAFAFGYYAEAEPVVVGFAMLVVFPVVAVYEGTRYQGSHNLIPFEIAFVATWAIPIILACWLGRFLTRRSGRRGLWGEGDDERGRKPVGRTDFDTT